MSTQPAKLILVSGQYPYLAESLQKHGFTPIKTLFDPRLPAPIASHPDMQACRLGHTVFVLKGSPLRDKLASHGLTVQETAAQPQKAYPGDALCNGFAIGPWFVANPKSIDPKILKAAQTLNLQTLPVRQGYASCSTVRVDEKAAITADPGIARSLESKGIQILRIRPGHIQLPGYDTGFIGGCCGKLSPNVLAVSGRLSSHPDGPLMQSFLESRGVSIIELSDNTLTDVGGIQSLP